LVALYCEPPASPVVAGFLVSHEIFSSADEQPAEREVLNIAVDPAYRRLGIGRQLLAAELQRGGIHFLEVRESNTPAQELYRVLGFEVVGRRKEYYDHPKEAAILMRHPSLKPIP
jgi:ribosomal-protein-alanine N-acetyltransferase